MGPKPVSYEEAAAAAAAAAAAPPPSREELLAALQAVKDAVEAGPLAVNDEVRALRAAEGATANHRAAPPLQLTPPPRPRAGRGGPGDQRAVGRCAARRAARTLWCRAGGAGRRERGRGWQRRRR
jgi:hypothetical protein